MIAETNTSPLISIVVPIYNRAHTIRPTIDSVLKQSRGDWELIVVDDCSKDYGELEDIVSSYGDPRIMLLRHTENRHGSAARNTGIKAAKGKYLALLDSDDIWYADKLQKTIPRCTSENTVVYSQVKNAAGVVPRRALMEEESVGRYLISNNGTMQTSSLIMQLSLAKRVLFDETLPRFQDYDFVIRLQTNGANFVFVPECLVEMTDVDTGSRISNQVKVEPALYWLERIDSQIDDRTRRDFYLRRVVRLMVISLQQDRIFKDMPESVFCQLSNLDKLKLTVYRFMPSIIISAIRTVYKKLKASIKKVEN